MDPLFNFHQPDSDRECNSLCHFMDVNTRLNCAQSQKSCISVTRYQGCLQQCSKPGSTRDLYFSWKHIFHSNIPKQLQLIHIQDFLDILTLPLPSPTYCFTLSPMQIGTPAHGPTRCLTPMANQTAIPNNIKYLPSKLNVLTLIIQCCLFILLTTLSLLLN